ncbi:DUF421 domain-containing protein [Alkalibacillus aidingensis]|uniref:DUF421 domain-containing protein n=1 Tax=Alkalibacillus aidingensis TaxID=2747607 RepID=UPI0016604F03|nr:DUF421 domain-containing protein [Alkalibacillus aidingensis]
MWLDFLKLVTLYLLIFCVLRLLGKSLFSQWTPYDFVTIVFLGYLAFIAIDIDGFFSAIIGILIIGFVYLVVSRLSLIQPFDRYIVGEATILIKHGKIIEKNLKRSRYSLTELLSSIRIAGSPDIKDIDYALLEPNGQISIIKNRDITPVTPRQLNIETEYKGLPIAVVIQGRVQKRNLKSIDKDEDWLMKELRFKGYKSLDGIYYAYVNDQTHSLTVDTVE